MPRLSSVTRLFLVALSALALAACSAEPDETDKCLLPVCEPCACDETTACDQGCDACDPECGGCRPAELDCGGGTGPSCMGSIPASRGVSQSCCPEWGPDACGAQLFCAAFDGRTQPSCYPERSRQDMTACTADVQCMSGGCNEEKGLCESIPTGACTVEIGCARGPGGETLACDPADQRCKLTSRFEGGLCLEDKGCDSGICFDGTCRSGARGSSCAEANDCSSKLCVNGLCRDGGDGSPCSGDQHCVGGKCVGGSCSSGREGSKCQSRNDCHRDNPFCVRGKCSDGWYGAECVTASDCHPNYPHCLSGRCDDGIDVGAPCTSSSQCAQPRSSLGAVVKVVCDSVKRTCVIANGYKCSVAWDQSGCETGTSCQPHTGQGRCEVENKVCDGSYCCGPQSCFYSCRDGWACQP